MNFTPLTRRTQEPCTPHLEEGGEFGQVWVVDDELVDGGYTGHPVSLVPSLARAVI